MSSTVSTHCDLLTEIRNSKIPRKCLIFSAQYKMSRGPGVDHFRLNTLRGTKKSFFNPLTYEPLRPF